MDTSRNSLATIILVVILAILGVILYKKFISPRLHKEIATHETPTAPAETTPLHEQPK